MYLITEKEVKLWVKEAIAEYVKDLRQELKANIIEDEPLIFRRDVAAILKISLVTLTDWIKRGLPFHKQRGRVYFIRSEVVEYVKKQQISPQR